MTDLLSEALEHIIKVARASRTRTNRLAWIEQRAVEALHGVPYDRDNFKPLHLNQKSALGYEGEIRRLKGIVNKYREELDSRSIWVD